MPCPKCNGKLIWKERSWTTAGEDPGHWSCIMCGEVVYPERDGLSTNPQNISLAEAARTEGENAEPMSYHLDPKKEEEIKVLLKTASVREIVAKTGVAKNTILRIRNENFTAEERERLKKSSLIKGRNKRELEEEGPKTDLQNGGQNIPEIIPSSDFNKKGGEKMRTDKGKECSRKECKRRGQVLPFEEFNKNRATPDGYEYHCRVCKAEESEVRRNRLKKEGRSGDGRRKSSRQKPGPHRSPSLSQSEGAISEAVTLDVQLLRAVKKSAILDFVKNDLPKMVEEAFA